MISAIRAAIFGRRSEHMSLKSILSYRIINLRMRRIWRFGEELQSGETFVRILRTGSENENAGTYIVITMAVGGTRHRRTPCKLRGHDNSHGGKV